MFGLVRLIMFVMLLLVVRLLIVSRSVLCRLVLILFWRLNVLGRGVRKNRRLWLVLVRLVLVRLCVCRMRLRC